MNRRDLVKHTIVGLSGLATGYVVVEQATEQTSASATLSMGSLNIQDAERTDSDGEISGVKIKCSGEWSYEIPSGKDPHRWIVNLQITDGENTATVDQTSTTAKYLTSSGSYDLAGSITDTDLYDPSDFAAPEGKQKEVTLGVVILFEVINPNGESLASAMIEDTPRILIKNPAYQPQEYGSIGGSGSLIIVD